MKNNEKEKEGMKEIKKIEKGMIFTFLSFPDMCAEDGATLPIGETDVGLLEFTPSAWNVLIAYSRNETFNPIGKKFQIIEKFNPILKKEILSIIKL